MVTIPANEPSVTFDIDAVDDDLVDGTKVVTITPMATGYEGGSDTLDVTDHEQLTVAITDDEISENGGTTNALVTRTDPTGALTVNLVSNDTSEATVVGSVVIPDGETVSPSFVITALNDAIVDGTKTVSITASATGYLDGSDTLDVTDFERLTVSTADSVISEFDGSTTGTVERTDPSGDLTINLMSEDTSEATVVASVVIVDGLTVSPRFEIRAADDNLLDATQTVAISASATGYVSDSESLDVLDHETLTVTIGEDSVSEDAGGKSATATVTRSNTDNGSELVVTLANDDDTEIVIPATVTILADQSSANFDIDAVDDSCYGSNIVVDSTGGRITLNDPAGPRAYPASYPAPVDSI